MENSVTETIKSVELDENGNAIITKTITTTTDSKYYINFESGEITPIDD